MVLDVCLESTFGQITCHKSFKGLTVLWTNTAEEQQVLLCFLIAVFGIKPPLSLGTGTWELASCSVLECVVLCWLCLPVAPLVAAFHLGSHLFSSGSRIIVWSQGQNHLPSGFASRKARILPHIRTVLKANRRHV